MPLSEPIPTVGLAAAQHGDMGGYTPQQAAAPQDGWWARFFRAHQRYMPQSDLDLYAGAAYGTPFEPYINGSVAYQAAPGAFARQPSGAYANPVQTEPTEESRQRYAKVFAESLGNPVLALGADDPSRLGMVLNGGGMPAVGNEPWAGFMTKLMGINGLYRPEADIAVSTQPSMSPIGSTDTHELTHRGLMMTDVPVAQHHPLMGREDMLLGGGDAERNRRVQQIQQEAARRYTERQRAMGPR